MEKADKRYLRADEAFKTALIELCLKKNINDISVSEIIQKSGYSRNAFYAHYENKAAFIQHVIEQETQQFISAKRHVPPATMDISKLEAAKIAADTNLFSHVYDNRDLYTLLIQDRLMPNTIDYMLPFLIEDMRKNADLPAGFEWEVEDVIHSFDWEICVTTSIMKYFNMIQLWVKSGFSYSSSYMAAQKANSRHRSRLKSIE